jgi:hypothetical protein
MDGIRYANIGVAVATLYVLAGVLVFGDASEGVIQAIGLSGFVLGLAVYWTLDERDKRRKRRDQ